MSTANVSELPQVQQILKRCRRQILQHTVLVGGATLLTALLAYLLGVSLLDYFFGLPGLARAIILVCFAGTTAYVAWKAIVVPLRSSIPAKELSAAVDLSCPDLHESLTTLISIQSPEATSSEAGSALMRDRLEQQVTEQLGNLNPQQFVNGQKMKQRCGIAGATVLLAVIPLLLWPSASGLSVKRILNPFANLATVSNLFFEVKNADRTVARSSDVVIKAIPKWRTGENQQRPERVSVELIAPDGRLAQQPMSYDEVNSCYTSEILSIQQDVKYRIVGGGASSETFQLTVVDAPEISLAFMTATPPLYSGRPIERFDGMVEDMRVFERSELMIQLEFSKPVESATLVWKRRDERPLTEIEQFDIEFDNMTGEEVVPAFDLDLLNREPEPLPTTATAELSPDRMSASIKMEADVGGDFTFEIVDEHQLTNPPDLERKITVEYDSPPELAVSGIRNNDRYRPGDILPVNCLAKDDVGLGAVELHYFINTNPTVVIPASEFRAGAFEVREKFRLNLEDFGLKDGDSINIRIRATDERPVPGPHEVWSEEYSIDIDNNAKPPGARALEQQTQEMIERLKQLESQLEKDQQQADTLRQQARQKWDEAGREKAQRLSEKEQQQGRILEQLTSQVADHPLMKDAAKKLQELSPQLRDELPEMLEKAADQQRNLAADTLKQSADKIDDIRETLREQIQEIEERAKLEQDLAELNRLALDAEKLAQDSDQLETDRQSDTNKPETMEQQEWDQQLDDRQQQLSQQRENLTDDIERLLDEEEQLRQAAQRAQTEKFEAIQETARQLAEQQNRVADGVDNEAKEVARDAFQTVQDLKKAAKRAEELNKQIKQSDSKVVPPELEELQQAIDQLNAGNLNNPQKQIEQLANQLSQASDQLNDEAADSKQSDQAAEQSKENAKLSQELAQQLQELTETLERIKQQRSKAGNDSDEQTPPADQQPGTPSEPQPATSSQQEVGNLMQRIDELADAANQISNQLQQTAQAGQQVKSTAATTAEKTNKAKQEASAGQFSKSAEQFREASQSAMESEVQMEAIADPALADQQAQMQNLQSEMNRMAEALDEIQQDNAAQAAAQQQAQQNISKDASQLPKQLSELAERMQMEALQMQQQAEQANAAKQAAQQAQQSASQASDELQDSQFQQASQSGKQAAEQLNQVANGASQGGEKQGDSNALVPTEVGESVADALQNLQKAAEAMKQASEQESQGESGESAEQGGESGSGEPGQDGESASGEGQPGEGPPSEDGQQSGQGKPGQAPSQQQLDAAAKSLAQAASEALPNQFNPNKPPDGNDSQQAGKDAMGNAVMWDGKLPDDVLERIGGSRDWGKGIDELDSETSDSIQVGRDSEYQSLIRMYFKELAKATGSSSQAIEPEEK